MTLRETFIYFAKANADSNAAVISLLNNCTNDDREKARGSYYKNLSGLFRHIFGGTYFLLSLLKDAVSQNKAASTALSNLLALPMMSEGALTESQWKDTVKMMQAADKAYIELAEALGESDFSLMAETPIFTGKPDKYPAAFILQQLTLHNTHHRGQISQILDEMKIDHNYSGINAAVLQS
jgi:uncharacterized damage-inducible protein DinB